MIISCKIQSKYRFITFSFHYTNKGKFHQNLQRMTSHVIATSVKSFNKYVNDVRFVDFLVVSPTVAVITRDGSHITNKSNIPLIR